MRGRTDVRGAAAVPRTRASSTWGSTRAASKKGLTRFGIRTHATRGSRLNEYMPAINAGVSRSLCLTLAHSWAHSHTTPAPPLLHTWSAPAPPVPLARTMTRGRQHFCFICEANHKNEYKKGWGDLLRQCRLGVGMRLLGAGAGEREREGGGVQQRCKRKSVTYRESASKMLNSIGRPECC